MRNIRIVAAALFVVSSGIAFAQAPGGPPAPSPEQKRLGYFVGHWTTEADVKPNPFMPAGKMISQDTCTWFAGEYAVVCTSEGTSPMGPAKALGIMGYSSEEKVYTYYGVDNSPMAAVSVAKGSFEKGTWTYTDEEMMGGKTVKSRYVIKEESPRSYLFSWGMLGEDGAWKTIVEGRSSKK
jgi:hypothetical protein